MDLVDTTLIVPVVAPSVPRFFGFGYAGFCQSAMEVGGDFFAVCPLSERSLLLAVADVMGKGSAAALFLFLVSGTGQTDRLANRSVCRRINRNRTVNCVSHRRKSVRKIARKRAPRVHT